MNFSRINSLFCLAGLVIASSLSAKAPSFTTKSSGKNVPQKSLEASTMNLKENQKPGLLAVYVVAQAADQRKDAYVNVGKGTAFTIQLDGKLYIISASHIFQYFLQNKTAHNINAQIIGQSVQTPSKAFNLRIVEQEGKLIGLSDILFLELQDRTQDGELSKLCPPLKLAQTTGHIGDSATCFGVNFYKNPITTWQSSGKLQENQALSPATGKFCLAVDFNTFGGVSGGPLFNANGEVIGVASTGYEMDPHKIQATAITAAYFSPLTEKIASCIADPAKTAKLWVVNKSITDTDFLVAADATDAQAAEIIQHYDLLSRNFILGCSSLLEQVATTLDKKQFNAQRFEQYKQDLLFKIHDQASQITVELNKLNAKDQLEQMPLIVGPLVQAFQQQLIQSLENCRITENAVPQAETAGDAQAK